NLPESRIVWIQIVGNAEDVTVKRIEEFSLQLNSRTFVDSKISQQAEIFVVVIGCARIPVVTRVVAEVVRLRTATSLLNSKGTVWPCQLRIRIGKCAAGLPEVAANGIEE